MKRKEGAGLEIKLAPSAFTLFELLDVLAITAQSAMSRAKTWILANEKHRFDCKSDQTVRVLEVACGN